MEKFVITKDYVKKVRRFDLVGRTLEFKLKPLPMGVEPTSWVRDAVNQVIEKATEGLRPTVQVGFSFCSKDFQRGEGWMRFCRAEEVSHDAVWNTISSVYQSNSTGLNTETFCLGVTSVKMPSGKGRARKYNSFDEECRMRRGIISINNKDNMCLPRALVVAIAYVNKNPELAKMRKDIGKIQSQRALQLCTYSKLVIPEEGCGIPELEFLQKYLHDYKIVVYRYGSKGREVIFMGASENNRNLNLLHNDGHYNVIISLTSAFCCNYYCDECHTPYNTKNDHRCGGRCPACRQTPPCCQDIDIKCADCLRKFRGQSCYDKHKKGRSMGQGTVCEQVHRCEQCYKVVLTGRKHTCGEVFCKICNTHVPEDHLCYMQPDAGKLKIADTLFVFYDLETRQEKVLENGDHLHIPNLCVFKQCCGLCLNNDNQICERCGVRLHILKQNPIDNFIEFILNQRKIFKQVVVIAHNGQAFDHQFILNYILIKTDLKPELIMRGTKIIKMSVGNVKFLDSLNYFPMALSKLPKAFGLVELKKGYFPHLFNTLENENYVGPLPAMKYYDADNMKEDDRSKFLNWYEEHKNGEFDMQRGLVEYCISDVNILAQSCIQFREKMLSTSNVCPFTEACTIASACNKVFRRNFLKPNTIGIMPKNGYRWRDNQSKIAIKWLVWEEKERLVNILQAAKQQEAVVAGVKVDGFCSETNQVFEFHGCYYHGCLSCFKYSRDDSLHDDPTQTLNSRFESTLAKSGRLRDLGYEVIEMWECEFGKLLKDNAAIAMYTEYHPLVTLTPLNPRDAFYGGRTGNTFDYYKAKEGEKIKYVDVCSLYPWVCKYGKFPIGHPKVYIGQGCNKSDLEKTEGVIKCKILPPSVLFHPVLPQKMNGKLMFVLCRTCGEEMNQNECNHCEEERALMGTWVIDEVVKAIEKGYEIKEIHEIWSYQVEQFDKTKKIGGLFRGMMDKFLKIKQQASGWPGNCATQEQKNAYIQEFSEIEDVRLEYEEILENPGLRSLAKLILNSFWGKFGQRENQPKTKIVNEPCEFFGILSNPAFYVNAVLPVNENTLVVNYEHREEAYDTLTTVNVAIAAYVTAQARLKLYSFLEKLEDRVLYFDTDSIIYVSREGEPNVPTGKFVGDMTDELESYGLGSYITEFVSGGPKNYAYKVWSTKTQQEEVVCKVKGISLTYAASLVVNFDTIKEMILSPSEPVYITSRNIRRTKSHEVVTREEIKMYSAKSTKRKFISGGSSVPYGHIHKKPRTA